MIWCLILFILFGICEVLLWLLVLVDFEFTCCKNEIFCWLDWIVIHKLNVCWLARKAILVQLLHLDKRSFFVLRKLLPVEGGRCLVEFVSPGRLWFVIQN